MEEDKLISGPRLQELLTRIDPHERLDPAVEKILLEVADEFIESVTHFACKLAKHRKSDIVEVKDFQLHLERNWNIRIPGYAADEIRSHRKPQISSSHNSKLQAVNSSKLRNSRAGKAMNYVNLKPSVPSTSINTPMPTATTPGQTPHHNTNL